MRKNNLKFMIETIFQKDIPISEWQHNMLNKTAEKLEAIIDTVSFLVFDLGVSLCVYSGNSNSRNSFVQTDTMFPATLRRNIAIAATENQRSTERGKETFTKKTGCRRLLLITLDHLKPGTSFQRDFLAPMQFQCSCCNLHSTEH